MVTTENVTRLLMSGFTPGPTLRVGCTERWHISGHAGSGLCSPPNATRRRLRPRAAGNAGAPAAPAVGRAVQAVAAGEHLAVAVHRQHPAALAAVTNHVAPPERDLSANARRAQGRLRRIPSFGLRVCGRASAWCRTPRPRVIILPRKQLEGRDPALVRFPRGDECLVQLPIQLLAPGLGDPLGLGSSVSRSPPKNVNRSRASVRSSWAARRARSWSSRTSASWRSTSA